MKEGLKFLYTNADQFVNKRDDLVSFISNDEPDIIMITEVIPKRQIHPITQALLDIEGYNSVFNFDPDDTNLGACGLRGVAIYHKQSLQVTEVDFDIEGFYDHAWIEVIVNNQAILCGCVYRSPSDSDVNESLDSTSKVIKLIKAAHRSNQNLLITGDFNYKEIDWATEFAPTNKEYLQNFVETLRDCFLFQNVTEPTRYRENDTPNLLDLLITSDNDMVRDIIYHPPIGESDHLCLTFTAFDTHYVTPETASQNAYNTNYCKVREELQNYDWHILLKMIFIATMKFSFIFFIKRS